MRSRRGEERQLQGLGREAAGEFQGPLVLLVGLGVPAGRFGRQTGRQGGRQGLLGVAGSVEVPRHRGQIGRVVAADADGGEGPAVGGVEAGGLPGQERGVGRLLQQAVPEGVGAGPAVGDQDVMVHALPQPGQQRRLGGAGDLGQDPVGDGPDGSGDRPRRRPGVGRERAEPGGEDRRQRRRQLLAPGGRGVSPRQRRREPASSAGRGQQLLHEERIALGAAPDLVEQLGLGSRAEDRSQLGGDVVLAETVEGQEFRPPAPAQLGQERQKRMAGQNGLAAHCRHHQRSRAAGHVGQHETEQIAGGPVRVGEPIEHPLEDPGPITAARLAGPDPGVVTEQRAERLDEGPVGRARLAAVDAAPGQHRRPPPGGESGELPQEAGLAGAALAFDHDRRGAALLRVVQRRRQPGDLRLAPDEGGRSGGGHASL